MNPLFFPSCTFETVAQHRITWRDGIVSWRTVGQGVPLVLLHGGHGDWGHWARNINALATRYQLWIPDMPGYGDTTTDAATVDDIVQGLDETARQCFDATLACQVAGFSFGGLVAALLAPRLATRRLALLGPAGHGGPRRERPRMQSWRVARDDPRGNLKALRANLMSLMLHDETAADEVAMDHYSRAVTRTRFRSKPISLSDRLRHALQNVDVPVLALWGEHDVTAVPKTVGPLLCDGRPERTWEVVAGAGHWVQWERADYVNARLLDWLDSPVP